MEDNTVAPKESEWFGFWDDKRDVILMKHQQDYIDDTIGLKTLYEAGQMYFYSGFGDHMHLEEYMIHDLLAPLLLNQTPVASQY